jgi:hypothetical protein
MSLTMPCYAAESGVIVRVFLMASGRIGTSGRDKYTAHDATVGVSRTDGTLP